MTGNFMELLDPIVSSLWKVKLARYHDNTPNKKAMLIGKHDKGKCKYQPLGG